MWRRPSDAPGYPIRCGLGILPDLDLGDRRFEVFKASCRSSSLSLSERLPCAAWFNLATRCLRRALMSLSASRSCSTAATAARWSSGTAERSISGGARSVPHGALLHVELPGTSPLRVISPRPAAGLDRLDLAPVKPGEERLGDDLRLLALRPLPVSSRLTRGRETRIIRLH